MAHGQFAVAEAIGSLGQRIRNIAREDAAAQQSLAQFGLTEKRLELMGLQKERENKIELAKLQREQELDTPSAMGNLVSVLPESAQGQASEFLSQTIDPATNRPFAETVSTQRKFVESFGKIRKLIADKQAADKLALATRLKEIRVSTAKEEAAEVKAEATKTQAEAKIKSTEKIATAKIVSTENIDSAKGTRAKEKAKKNLNKDAIELWTELQAAGPFAFPQVDGRDQTRREFIKEYKEDVLETVKEKTGFELSEEKAREFLEKADGNKRVARQMAQEAGFIF